VISRDEIRRELWPEGTFVDFDQAVNFSIKQIRDVLGDAAERPLYIETIPKRGYRFIAPISDAPAGAKKPPFNPDGSTTLRLEKALWTNITELRLAEARRRRYVVSALILLAVLSIGFALFVLASR
jgi:DNA-binding winged helix-turn-helix (wHTH) protein